MRSEWAEGYIWNKSYRRSLFHLSSSLAFILSLSFLLRTAPHYLNALNRHVRTMSDIIPLSAKLFFYNLEKQ